jgi:hypothetical protein
MAFLFARHTGRQSRGANTVKLFQQAFCFWNWNTKHLKLRTIWILLAKSNSMADMSTLTTVFLWKDRFCKRCPL